jgi:hypothetical protein
MRGEYEMTGSLDYDITFKQEILREVAASVRADYSRYMYQAGIDYQDKDNLVVMLANDAFSLKEYVLTDCKTLDDLRIVEGKLQGLKSIVERLLENAARKVG